MNFGLRADFPASQKLINQSTLLDVNLNRMDVDRSKNGKIRETFLWPSNNDTTDKTGDILSNVETVSQVPRLESTYFISGSEDNDDDTDFSTIKTFSQLNEKSTCILISFESCIDFFLFQIFF